MNTMQDTVMVSKTTDSYPFRPLSKKQIVLQLEKARGGKYKDAGVVLKEFRAGYGL